MAFELGGRADKFGNRYERRYFVSLMAKVLQGGLLSVQSEPTGDDESGTDIIVEYQGGRKDFHQCKARNGSNEHWTMSALARHKVFQHIKDHVKTEQNRFVFVTALPFVALNDLCLAARNSDLSALCNGSADDVWPKKSIRSVAKKSWTGRDSSGSGTVCILSAAV